MLSLLDLNMFFFSATLASHCMFLLGAAQHFLIVILFSNCSPLQAVFIMTLHYGVGNGDFMRFRNVAPRGENPWQWADIK